MFFTLDFYSNVIIIGIINSLKCIRSRNHLRFVLLFWFSTSTIFLVQRFQENNFGTFKNFALLTRYVGQLIYRTWWLCCYLWTCLERIWWSYLKLGSGMALSCRHNVRFGFVLLHIRCEVLHKNLLIMMHVSEFVLSDSWIKLFVLKTHFDWFPSSMNFLS